MKLSELIEQAQKTLNEHGDLEVNVIDGWHDNMRTTRFFVEKDIRHDNELVAVII